MIVLVGGIEREITCVENYLLSGGGVEETVEEILINGRADRLIKKEYEKKINKMTTDLLSGERENINFPELNIEVDKKILKSKTNAGDKARKIELAWASEANLISEL